MNCIVKVVQARNLPIMNVSQNNTDAYVEVKFGPKQQHSFQTEVKKSLNPIWEENNTRFLVPEMNYFQENVLEFM